MAGTPPPVCIIVCRTIWGLPNTRLPRARYLWRRSNRSPPKRAADQGYLRAGAWICGEPAWDPDFNTADLPILMPMAKVSNRYAKHYLGQAD